MNFFKIFKSKKVILGALAIIVLVYFFAFRGENGKQLATVQRGEIIQEVAATGKVKPSQSVELGFDKSGRVGAVYAFVGDFVRAGEIIASLDSGESSAEVAKAKAILNEEILRLREIENSSPRSYEDSVRSLEVAVRDAFLNSDNAVRNKVDQFFKNVPSNPTFEITFTDGNFIHYFPVPSEKKISLNNERKSIEVVLNNWSGGSFNFSGDTAYVNADKSIADMKKVLNFLDNVASAMNSLTPANFEYESTVNGYKTSISSARSDVATSLSSLIAARDALTSAPQLDSQTGEYKDVLIQRAKVDQARSALSSLEAALGKSFIKAPFDGVLTVQDAKVGSAVTAGETLVTMTSNNDLYVEANISEINIGKLAEGNPVSIKFDAFRGEEFNGFVSFIEPGDVLIEGVVNYKIRVDFGTVEEDENGKLIWNSNAADERIKNGLTADLKIETFKNTDTTVVPLYAVLKEDGKSFVNKVVNGEVSKVEVELGREGSNGMVEILSGVTEGETVEF